MKSILCKFEAFTLAEVLLTLLIIGVVASLTLPSLINDSKDAELKTAWKKVFAELSQVSNLIINLDCGGNFSYCVTDNTYTGRTIQIRDLYANRMSTIKKCSGLGDDGARACASDYYGVWMLRNTYGDASGFIANNGTMITTYNQMTWCTGENTFCGIISVDVNGVNGPNIVGKDVFAACQFTNKIVPAGVTGCTHKTSWNNSYLYLSQ